MKNIQKYIGIVLVSLISLTVFASGNVKWKKENLKVSGNCGMCKKNIENACKIDGVEVAYWNPDKKILKVKYDSNKTNTETILKKVAEAGYDNQQFKANETAYQKLHKCCQYRTAKCEH